MTGAKFFRVVAIALAISMAAGVNAATTTTTIQFDTGDLSQFSMTGTAGTFYTLNPTSGVGGGGGLVIGSGTSGGAVIPKQYDLTRPSTMSIDYLQGNSDTFIDASFGFIANPANVSIIQPNGGGVWLRSYPVNFANAHETDVVRSDSNGTLGSGNTGFSPTFGNWYRLEMSLTRNTTFLPTEAMNATLTRYDLGPTGTSTPTIARQNTYLLIFGDMYSKFYYPAFAGSSGNSPYDNFTITGTSVPEPASLAGFTLMCGLLMGRRSRRRA